MIREVGLNILGFAEAWNGPNPSNLSFLDFSLLLPDVMTIADEVDAQLTQAMDSYMNAMRKAAAA